MFLFILLPLFLDCLRSPLLKLLNYHFLLQTEVELLGQIQHPNIISLIGYSIHGETRLLVYELMQNGSLEAQLHGRNFIVLDSP